MTNDPLKVLVDTIQKLERRGAQRSLKKILDGTRPADLARLLRLLPEHQRHGVFQKVDQPEDRALILSEIHEDILPSFLEHIPDEELVPLLEEMFSDDTADILACVPEERKEQLLRKMRREDMDEAQDLLRYDPESAGGIMVPDAFSLDEATTCQEAIATLQAQHDDLEMAFYLYVVNTHEHLVGVVSLRQLVISPPQATLSAIMETDVVRVLTSDDQEMVARLVARYNLLALPVVDEHNRLVGIVTVDDVIDVIREEATEDMLKMAGAGESFDSGVIQATRSRLPWLFASWIGGVGASLIIHGFEEQLSRIALLAAFIPVILGMGGNAGTQSLTVVTRGLALGRIQLHEVLKVVTRETSTGALCGGVYGLLLGVVGGFMSRGDAQLAQYGSPLVFAVTIGVSLGAAMMLAAFVGSAVPILFERLSIDPAVATGPFVTTAVDVLGVLFYFGVSVVLLGI
jgi:magnesium transporter